MASGFSPSTDAGGPARLRGEVAGARPVYPAPARGRFYRKRAAVAATLVTAFLALPHVKLNHQPALQIDLDARQLHLFGTTFFATDTLLLALFGVAWVLFIALFTALFGRVWCGWACPQPIYLEFVFRPLEALFEGPAGRRMRAARGPLTAGRLARKVLKWAAYLAIALLLAHTFVAYFVGAPRLYDMLGRPPTDSWGAFVAVAIVTGMILLDYGWARELTCVIACPYGRLQSVLIDARSWIVGYDAGRGEPRRRLQARRQRAEPAGDCIDCHACLRSCPTAIDIRDGLQLECIGCTQCMDACDRVMDKTRRPRGLIRYTSLDELRGRRTRFWRPRVFVYAGVVMLAITGLSLVGGSRSAFEVDVVRRPGAPFYVQSDGLVVNQLRIRVTNRSPHPQSFTLDVKGPPGAELLGGRHPVTVAPLQVHSVDVLVRLPRTSIASGRRAAEIRVIPRDQSPEVAEFVLLGPAGGAT